MGQLKRTSQVLGTQFSRKTKSMRTTVPSPAIESLPEDLLVEILAKVGANSLTDLFNTKLATKKFLKASEDGQIYRHVSLENFPKIAWKNKSKNSTKVWSFIETCNHNKNPQALYTKGMLELFTDDCKEASGIAKLKASAEKNHLEASYVYGVVLYSASSKEEGMRFLKRCEDESGVRMVECRRRVKEFASTIWKKNQIFSPERVSGHRRSDCVDENNCRGSEVVNGWDRRDEDNSYGEHTCEPCKWDGEVLRFCNMLKTGSYN